MRAPFRGLENLHGPASAFASRAALVAKGEFPIVIAGLGVGVEPQLGPLSDAYVLLSYSRTRLGEAD